MDIFFLTSLFCQSTAVRFTVDTAFTLSAGHGVHNLLHSLTNALCFTNNSEQFATTCSLKILVFFGALPWMIVLHRTGTQGLSIGTYLLNMQHLMSIKMSLAVARSADQINGNLTPSRQSLPRYHYESVQTTGPPIFLGKKQLPSGFMNNPQCSEAL